MAVRELRVQPEEAPLNGGGNYNPLKVMRLRCLSKIWPYAGKSEYLALLAKVKMRKCRQSAGKTAFN